MDRVGPDGSGVSVVPSLGYDRTLVTATPDMDGDFRGTPELKCSSPDDCASKCRMLSRTSRNGVGAPPACMLCDLPCTNNVAATVTDLVFAIFHDVTVALKLAAICLGNGGPQKCVCAIGGMLRPHWLKVTTDPMHRCEGDPMQNVMGKLLTEAVKLAEDMVNREVILKAKDVSISVPLPDPIPDVDIRPFDWMEPLCIDLPPWEPHRSRFKAPDGTCGAYSVANEQMCDEFAQGQSDGVERLCYHMRVREICLDAGNHERYQELFALGYQSTDDLRAQYAAAFGDSYQYQDPDLVQLFRDHDSTERNFAYQRDICDDVSLFDGMTLDMVRTPCLNDWHRCAGLRSSERGTCGTGD